MFFSIVSTAAMIILENGFFRASTIVLVTIFGIGLLDGKVYFCLILLAGTKRFSKVVAPVYNHPVA